MRDGREWPRFETDPERWARQWDVPAAPSTAPVQMYSGGFPIAGAVTVAMLTTVLSDAAAAGWHSERTAKEILRRYGGAFLARLDE